MTPQQEAVVVKFAKGESLAVRAVAGSGKTTTLVAAAQSAPTGALAIAFNKKTAEELKVRLPAHMVARTFNSIGHSAWANHIGRQIKLDTRKLWTLWNNYKGKEAYDEAAKDIVNMVRFARVYGITPGFGGRPTPNYDEWSAHCEQHDLEDVEALWEPATWLLKESAISAFEGLIDFDDQIYMPLLFNSLFPKFTSILVDEAQDLSGMNHDMVSRCLAKNGQLAIFGDPNQAIYAFRGASEASFGELAVAHNLEILPLTCSFRCPKAVVREARAYVPDMSSAEDAPEGEVERGEDAPLPTIGTTVLSRTNAPLVSLAFASIRAKVPVDYLGRDFLSGLKALHTKAPTPKALRDWQEEHLAKAKSDGAKERIKDKVASLLTLHEESKTLPVEAALAKLMVTPAGGAFILSTVHKAKGLEWNNVVFLSSNKKQQRGGQAHNVNYVALTRSKRRLFLHLDPPNEDF